VGAGAAELRRSWVHGDYKTDNLLIAGPRLVGLDMHLIHESVVHYDVAAFLNRLQLTLLHARAWRLLPHRVSFEAGFVGEALREDGQRTALPLAWVRLYMILCSWMGQSGRQTGWAKRRYLDLCFRRLTARLTADLAQLQSN
jgi:Ser/Thr protein kinase RdoA (MazF antagonist)